MNKKCSHPDYYAVCINEWDDTQACVLCLREEIERLRAALRTVIEAGSELNRQLAECRRLLLAEAVTSQKARDETHSHTHRVIENLPEARRLLLEG